MNSANPEFRGRIYDDIIETIGATPLVRFSRLAADAGVKAEILGKLEFFNPLASVKDRIGFAMIDAMAAKGVLKKHTVMVEPTSGNTGIALAFVAAARGYRLVLTMPDSMSIERRKMLKLLNAELELTPAEKGMKGAIARAQEIIDSLPDAVMPSQFENPANPDIHRKTTAEEIWKDTGGNFDMLVSGVGTGGTLTGCGELFKSRNPDIRIVAVEPEDSPVLSGGEPGPHKIQGIGAGFVPAILKTDLIDETVSIANETAFSVARKVAALEGCPVGISAGAALAATLEIAERPEMRNKRIVVIIPDFAERYLSTAMFENITA